MYSWRQHFTNTPIQSNSVEKTAYLQPIGLKYFEMHSTRPDSMEVASLRQDHYSYATNQEDSQNTSSVQYHKPLSPMFPYCHLHIPCFVVSLSCAFHFLDNRYR